MVASLRVGSRASSRPGPADRPSSSSPEAAKVLILLDTVRCPPSKGEERWRTLARWNSHLWKGLYARMCDDGLAHSDFGDVQDFIERESAHFFLDGPTRADWVFPNGILAEREGRMYVDFVRDVTPAEDGAPQWWSTPSTYEYYSPAGCLYLVDVLAHLGAASVEVLEAVADVWRDFEPPPRTSREELRSLIGETLRELEARGVARVRAADARLIDTVHRWPFPLWSLAPAPQHGNQAQQLRDIRQERDGRLQEIRARERVREPPIRISEDRVDELHKAYVAYDDDRRRHEAMFTRHLPGGLRIIPAAIPGYDVQSGPHRALARLWRELSEDERVSLAALAIFSRGSIAD